MPMKPRVEAIVGIALIVGAVAVAVAFSVIAGRRSLTGLEAVLLQAFSLFAGLIGSFLFGRQSAEGAARQMLKPHARSAFRRLLSLYQSLSRMARVIESARVDPQDWSGRNLGADRTLEVLRAIVTEQISTADDALEDWRDLVPEDVAGIRQRAQTGLHPLTESLNE